MEGEGRPHDDRCGQREGEPLPVVELQRRNHCHSDDRHGEKSRDDQAGTKLAQITILRGFRIRVDGVRRAGRLGERGGITGVLDGSDQIFDGYPVREGDLGLLRCVVDGGCDAVDLVELLLDS